MGHARHLLAYKEAVKRGDGNHAVVIATRMAGTRSASGDDIAAKLSLLMDLEGAVSLPKQSLSKMLMAGIERELAQLLSGKLPLRE